MPHLSCLLFLCCAGCSRPSSLCPEAGRPVPGSYAGRADAAGGSGGWTRLRQRHTPNSLTACKRPLQDCRQGASWAAAVLTLPSQLCCARAGAAHRLLTRAARAAGWRVSIRVTHGPGVCVCMSVRACADECLLLRLLPVVLLLLLLWAPSCAQCHLAGADCVLSTHPPVNRL